MDERHSRLTDEGRAFWSTTRLWAAAAGLPVRRVEIASIAEFDEDCWFGEAHAPTCRAVAEHARRIAAADLSHPIILSSDGQLMDGGHRVAKAWLAGLTEIDAVRFEVDPPPDFVTPLPKGAR
jgi:hypothetical protein